MWHSSDASVASVNAGRVVTAHSTGTATSTAASPSGPSAACVVTVRGVSPVPQTGDAAAPGPWLCGASLAGLVGASPASPRGRIKPSPVPPGPKADVRMGQDEAPLTLSLPAGARISKQHAPAGSDFFFLLRSLLPNGQTAALPPRRPYPAIPVPGRQGSAHPARR